MKHTGKRVLSILCTLAMLLSLMAMIVPGASASENEIDAIPTEHLLLSAGYTIFPEKSGQNTSYVADPDAYNGMAVRHMDDNINISITRYDGGEQKIGTLSPEQLKVGEGYQIHKFSFAVPENSTQGSFVYIMSNWQFQSEELCNELAKYAGQTVEVYISMKVTGPADGMYSLYIDRVVVADLCEDNLSEDGATCSKCGNLVGTPEELEILALQKAGQVYADYLATVSQDLDGAGGKVTDPDAKNQTTIKAGPYNLSETGFRFYAYSSGSDRNILLASVAPAQLKVGQGYQIYKLSMVVPETLADAACTYGIADNDWQFVSFNAKTAIQAFVGKQLDVYISLKITGSLSEATCYIDRMVFVDACENYVDRDGTCTKCGKTVCTKAEAELNVLRQSGQVYADYLATVSQDLDGAGGKVTDPDAKNQTAIAAGPYDLSETGFRFYAYSSGSGQNIPLDSVAPALLKVGQGYQLYKLSMFIPETLADAACTYCIADTDWQFVSFNAKTAVQAFVGKQLDVYISLKITGSLSEATCYIDQMIFVDSCENHMDDNGVCTMCGKVDELLNQIPSEHRVTVSDYSCFKENAELSTGYVYDADAYAEQAVCYNKANLTDNVEFISVGRYDPDGGFANDDPRLKIGSLMFDDLKIDQGYQVYKFTYDVPAETTAGKYLYIMSNWYVQSESFGKEFAAYAGQTVDVYLSLKVTGPATDGLYSVYVDRIALATACQWGEGVVSVAPTYESDGVMTYTCTVCGATKTETIEKLVEPTPAESWGLILDGDIGMKFVLNLTGEQIPNAAVEVAIGDDVAAYSAAELVDESGKAVLLIDVAAAQMTEEVMVTLFVDDQEVSKVYTVRQYADYILDPENGYGENVQNLVKAMLNYGAASQKYFAVNTGNYADAGLEITPAQVPNQGGAVASDGSLEGVSLYGASLVHESKTAVRFYFNAASVQRLTFKINGGEPCDVQYKSGKYFVELADICPQDLDEDIVVTVSNGTDTLTVTYAPMDYIIRMYNKNASNQNTKALVQALYGYYLAAEAYVAQ